MLLGWGEGALECSALPEEGQWAEGLVGHLGGLSLPPTPSSQHQDSLPVGPWGMLIPLHPLPCDPGEIMSSLGTSAKLDS